MAENNEFVIADAIKKKRIDLQRFADTTGNAAYIKFYEDFGGRCDLEKRKIIDLSTVADTELLEILIRVALWGMDIRYRLPKSYHATFIHGFRKIKSKISEDAFRSVQAFFDALTPFCSMPYGNERSYSSLCLEFMYDWKFKDNPFESDRWNLDEFDIAPERLDPTSHLRRLVFDNIKDTRNKLLVKKYEWYRLFNTGVHVSSIRAELGYLKNALNIVDRYYCEWNKDDSDYFINFVKNRYSNNRTIASVLMTMREFTNYLLVHDFIEDDPLKNYREMATAPYQYKATAEDRFVVSQIFNVLGKVTDPALAVCFLAIYCTGMRVSEATALKKDCLESVGNKSWFIRFYQNKMTKEVSNVIPKALFEIIDEYRSNLPQETEWLFPNKRLSGPRQKATFRENLSEEFVRLGVKNADGTPYAFTPHSFRHLMAVRMRNEDIPLQFIQEQLHHESPNMTMAYMEFMGREKASKMKTFIDNNAAISPIATDIKLTDDEAYAEYLRSYINAQMLPNGVCARPVKLGKCPHCNACMHCSDFRTSIEFLEIHQKQLAKTEAYISLAKEHGWQSQLKEAEFNAEKLKGIIVKLECLGKEADNQ